MKRIQKIILIIFGVLIIGGLGFYIYQSYQQPKTDTSKVSTAAKFQEPKIDSQNGVEVVATIKPQICDDFCDDSATFALSFTTHEGDLSFDLVKASTLEVDGKVFQAKSWDGGSGGHHLSGTLVFPGIEKEPTKIILRMKNIAGADRTFTWD